MPKKEVVKPLTRKEKQELRQQIEVAKEALAKDKASRPKKKLSPKQLENLARGRAANPKFKPKNDSLSAKLDRQSRDSSISNGHIAVGYDK